MWTKSTFSSQGNCVEVYPTRGRIWVRSSDRPIRTVWFTRDEWQAFVEGVKNGEFDLSKMGD